MSNPEMQYNFKPLKIYSLLVFCLLIFSLFTWVPQAEIILTIFPEPLIADFRIKLDASVKNIFFNLETIPAKIIPLNEFNKQEDVRLINDLIDEDNRNIIIFQEKDLLEFVDYKIKDISKGAFSNKDVLKINPKKWEIKVLKQDFSNKNALINLKINEQVIKNYDYDFLKENIISKHIDDAKLEIKKYLIVENIIIKIWPKFKKQLPMFKSRIKFDVNYKID